MLLGHACCSPLDHGPRPAAATACLQGGLEQYPKSPYLHIVYANFLIECRHQHQSGWAMLDTARKMDLNLSFRFSIFTREQEHKQKSASGATGDNASDLVSYVEFQRNYGYGGCQGGG